MKKLFYLIVAIAILGLIVPGCVPVAPSFEQGDLSTLTKTVPPPVWVDDDASPGWYDATHFETIQEGITAVAPYGIVNVLEGKYKEQIRIKKPLTLISDTGDYRTSGTILTGDTTIFLDAHEVSLTDVIIQGFKFENINISAGSDEGIIRDGEGSPVKNITILSNSFININNPAIKSYINAGEEMSEGWKIIDNYIENISSNGVSGMALYTLTNSVISNNHISDTKKAGILLDGVENITVSENIISNVPEQGIQVGYAEGTTSPSSNITVVNNLVTFANTSESSNKGGICIYPNQSNISITENTLTGNYNGITVRKKPGVVNDTIHVNFNNVYDNDGFGVGNFAEGGGILDATCNWWGHASGPYPTGTGDAISDNVDFEPWLLSPAPDAVCYGWYGFDKIVECAVIAKNHGKFVSCVTHLTKDWFKDGNINAKEKGAIMSWAAQADIP